MPQSVADTGVYPTEGDGRPYDYVVCDGSEGQQQSERQQRAVVLAPLNYAASVPALRSAASHEQNHEQQQQQWAGKSGRSASEATAPIPDPPSFFSSSEAKVAEAKTGSAGAGDGAEGLRRRSSAQQRAQQRWR